jgi:hypothetical protein
LEIEPVLERSTARAERLVAAGGFPNGSENGSDEKRLASEQPASRAAAPAANMSRNATREKPT